METEQLKIDIHISLSLSLSSLPGNKLIKSKTLLSTSGIQLFNYAKKYFNTLSNCSCC